MSDRLHYTIEEVDAEIGSSIEHINNSSIHVTAQNKQAWNDKYDKPEQGIPSTDMTEAVQMSLDKADHSMPGDTHIPSTLAEMIDDIDHRTVTDGEKSVWSGKQNAIPDLSDIRSGATAGSTAYQKPQVGIPSTDMTEAVRVSLGKADTAVQDLSPITDLIPVEASQNNQLADKAFVNSSIGTATAQFKGTFNLVTDLSLTTTATQSDIASALVTAVPSADNNDYAFVQIPTSDATPTEISIVDRYKFNGTAWAYEFSLNNSSFTADQWAAINSGITSALVSTFQNKYDKPSGGIPKNDLSNDVKNSLDKADTALQEHQSLNDYYTKTQTDALVSLKPDFIEEELTEDMSDEIDRVLAELYQALTDAGVAITETQAATALATAKANLANQAAGYATQQGDYAKNKADEIEDAKGDFPTLDDRLDYIEENAGKVDFQEDNTDNWPWDEN